MKVRDLITEHEGDEADEKLTTLAFLMADCIEELINTMDQIGRPDLAEPTRAKLGIRRDN